MSQYYQPEIPDNVSRETSGPIRIAVINQKGGVGKTTTAVNLAHGLAMKGKSVLLFDLDPQGNATTSLGVEKYTTNPSSYEFLFSTEKLAPTDTRYDNLKIFPSNISLVKAELDLLRTGDDRNFVLRNAVDAGGFQTDFILYDTPPSLGILTLNILIASDFIVVPVQTEFLALEGLTMLLDTVDEICRENNTSLQVLGCVLTMVDLRTNLCQQVVKEMREHLGDKVMQTLIPRTVRLSECPSHGKTIFEYERWGVGARAYESLCREVLDRLKAAGWDGRKS